MEIRQLEYFIAVAEELHFTKAANRLNMSQPPLSRQISQLESEIGAQLFIRTKRHVELTEAGKLFLEHSYYILNSMEKACDQTRNIHEGKSGVLKIGFTGLWSKRLIKFLDYYRSKFPDVDVQLIQMPTNEQIKALFDGRIHIATPCQTVNHESLESIVIEKLPFFIVLPSEHPLSSLSDSIDLWDLREYPFIMWIRKLESSYYDTIISICHQSLFSPRIYQEVAGISTILTLVEANWGITIVTKLALEHPKQGIVVKRIKDNAITIDLSVAWLKNETSPIVNNYILNLRKHLYTENKND